MAKGELQAVLHSLKIDELIDTGSKVYQDKNLAYMVYDKEAALLENPLLLKTPVIRDGRKATVGYVPDVWKSWIESSKKA